eukprot:Colp12_sorted_trinity150504_noHs@234
MIHYTQLKGVTERQVFVVLTAAAGSTTRTTRAGCLLGGCLVAVAASVTASSRAAVAIALGLAVGVGDAGASVARGTSAISTVSSGGVGDHEGIVHQATNHAVAHGGSGGVGSAVVLLLGGSRAVLQHIHAVMQVAHVLDNVGHGEVSVAVAPGELDGGVGPDEVVASVERGGEAGSVLHRHEEAQQLLGQLRVAGLAGGVDGVLVHAVLLGELHALRPALVALVDVGGDAAELQQLVLLHLLSQVDLVEVVEVVDGGAQSLVVLLGDVDLIEGLVHHGQVLLLHGLHVLHRQGQRVLLAQQVHHAGVVQVGGQHLQQALELHGVVRVVEADGLVMH